MGLYTRFSVRDVTLRGCAYRATTRPLQASRTLSSDVPSGNRYPTPTNPRQNRISHKMTSRPQKRTLTSLSFAPVTKHHPLLSLVSTPFEDAVAEGHVLVTMEERTMPACARHEAVHANWADQRC